ncbi:AMMECR1 family protein [Candida albicans]|uniref:AMMECR1 family protein n=1 Tax=Candida albicans TaxID=5476 RepID=A0A8H6F335_CANAX|nr:AMMECR1 family protein [Candida albicans]
MSKALSCYAFESLLFKLNLESNKIPLSKYFETLHESFTALPSRAPLFITWNKNHQLRGCIGTFSPLPIESGVSRYALHAALQDPRFSQLALSKLNLWRFHWEIGVNGLKISFQLNNEHYSGTFLPSVAEEENWDKLTTLYYLLKKADYPVSQKNVSQFYEKGLNEGWLELTRYDGLKNRLDYNEFIRIRNQVE